MKLWTFDFYQHWTETFFGGYNWKNFTFITLQVEYGDYLHPPGYLELHIAFMGFGLVATRLPPGTTEGMEELIDMAREAGAVSDDDCRQLGTEERPT